MTDEKSYNLVFSLQAFASDPLSTSHFYSVVQVGLVFSFNIFPSWTINNSAIQQVIFLDQS